MIYDAENNVPKRPLGLVSNKDKNLSLDNLEQSTLTMQTCIQKFKNVQCIYIYIEHPVPLCEIRKTNLTFYMP